MITPQPENVPIYTEFAAQTFARDLIEVRARVDGFIEKRSFDIGSDVKQGDVLYELDRQPYEAAVEKARGDLEQSEANVEFARRQVGLAQAQANLAQAEANQLKSQQDVNRLQPLVKEDAAAQQDLDNALAALKANDIPEGMRSIMTAVSEGIVTPLEGEILSRILTAHQGALTTQDLQRRVEELEEGPRAR